jgi:type I restriction enzyme R subunit
LSGKVAAIKYKKYLDEIGIVSSEVVHFSPDMREGEDSAYEKVDDTVKRFWDRMMQEHGNAKNYEKNIITRFKYSEEPEIIIVVDKLLTGLMRQ